MAWVNRAVWRANGSAIMLAMVAAPVVAQPPSLPRPDRDPLKVDVTADPVVRLIGTIGLPEGFSDRVRNAVEMHPALTEARAGRAEAVAARGEARAQRFPQGEVNISSFRTLARDFSNDPQNIIERSRARQRTDATVTLSAPLWDFGATVERIAAARARIDSADATVAATADDITLRAIVAWYDVFAYRSLVAVTDAYTGSQRELRVAVEERIRQGVSAEGDIAEVDSYVSIGASRLANYRRQLANAEARYTELMGAPPPATMSGPHRPAFSILERERAVAAAGETPAVRAAYAAAKAADKDAEAIRSENLPVVIAGVDAGRYGVFETDRDYDVRARLGLRYRLFGGRTSRANQAEARAMTAEARAARLRIEAERDASIAWSDLEALKVARDAQEQSYRAGRLSRDVLAERFRVSSGTLIGVLQGEDNFYQAAAQYILSEVELEVARYALMSRMGELLPAMGISPSPRLDWDKGDR